MNFKNHLQRMKIDVSSLNIIKSISKNTTVNVVLNDKPIKPFPLRLGMRQRYLQSPLLLSIVLEVR